MNIIEYIARNGYYNTLEKLAEASLTTPQPLPKGPGVIDSIKKVYSGYKSTPTKQISGGAPLSPPTPGFQASRGLRTTPAVPNVSARGFTPKTTGLNFGGLPDTGEGLPGGRSWAGLSGLKKTKDPVDFIGV